LGDGNTLSERVLALTLLLTVLAASRLHFLFSRLGT
jgi:hypothetical protein